MDLDTFNMESAPTIWNKTRKYLAPVFREYKGEFVTKMKQFSTVAIAIYDYSYPVGKISDPFIYFLFNIKKSKLVDFMTQIIYIRQHESYVDDYPFGELLYGKLHGVILKLPPNYNSAYSYFLESRYSEMYLPVDINNLFSINRTDSTKLRVIKSGAMDVLLRNPSLKMNIEQSLQANLSSDAELDSIWNPRNEILNYEKFDNYG